MDKKTKWFIFILIFWVGFLGNNMAQAKADDIIHFNDKSLESALCSAYDCEGPFTKEIAHELSTKDTYIILGNANISDLEGLQFFDGLTQVDLSYNKITNLEPLSKLPNLNCLDISCNEIKGKEFEKTIRCMGKIVNLDSFKCYYNDIEDISFLKTIGNTSNYRELGLAYNKINDISILKNCKNLEYLFLENNRITDVKPLKSLNNDTLNIYIYNNCIIDLKPIKPLFDNMFTDRCGADLTDRFDFYKNPVNIIYQNKEMQFPRMTVYYMNQAYVEAIPLIEMLGGSAKYDKNTGTLTCRIYDNELIMKDFSSKYTLNGKDKRMAYELRRMQFDTAYVSVKDLCNILGLNYHVLKERELFTGDSEIPEYFPEVVEISVYELSDKTNEYKFKVIDGQVGIIRYLGTEANVIIPSQINSIPVTFIEDGAFCEDINLISVEIPDSVTRIGTAWGQEGVFTNCDNLESIKLNEGKKEASIGSNAFSNCSNLSSIKIPGNYKVIYDNAFNNCTSLNAVTISEGVERIGAGAFASDEALVSVTIPSTMKALGYEYDEDITTDSYYINKIGVFSFCTSLREVNVLEGKADAYIGTYTFSECPKLESIMIPGNYYIIYEKAFINCINLKTIVYGKSNLINSAYQIIDQNAFEGCIKLKEISLPETLNSIGDYAFADCSSLKELVIPEGVTSIGNHAFSANTALHSVSIPSTILSIGSSVDDSFEGGTFYGCNNLTNVILKEGNKKATIGATTFKSCNKLKSIIIPGNYVTIGTEAFMECVELKTVIYKNNISPLKKQKILYNAFKGCTSLVTVLLPSTLTYLDEFVFSDCTTLKTITIPTGVNKLYMNDFIFDECTSLTRIYIGDYVKCSKYSLSMSNSKVIIYSNNKAVKMLAKYEEFEVCSPASDYVNGISLFGTINIIGAKKVGSILTADIEAVAPLGARISYVWTINDIVVSTENTYEVKINDKGKAIRLNIKGDKEYTGILTQTIVIANDTNDKKDIRIINKDDSNVSNKSDKPNREKINNIRYDGYYYDFDKTDNYLDLLKIFTDGKAIHVT